MDEATAFRYIVGMVTVITACRVSRSTQRAYLGACLLAQIVAITGLLTQNATCVAASHVSFTLAMWLGCAIAHGGDLILVVALCAFTWTSRRALGHCMFAHARGSRATSDDARYDLLYVIPGMIALARLLNA